MGKPTGFMEYAREDAPASLAYSKTIMNFTRSCLRLRENSRQPDVWTAVCRFVSMEK